MTHFLFSQFAILDILGRLLWWALGHEKFCLRLLRLLLKFAPFCERHSFLCIVAVYMLMAERSIHIMILTLQYFISDSISSLTFVIDDSPSRKQNPYYKLLDKNVSQLRYKETVTRGCFGPLSCRSTLQFLAIHVTRAQFVVLSMAFFTFILYKPELLQIGTILDIIDVLIKFLLLLRILRNWRTTRGRFLPLFCC